MIYEVTKITIRFNALSLFILLFKIFIELCIIISQIKINNKIRILK